MNRYTIQQEETTIRHNGHITKQVRIWDDYCEATIDLEENDVHSFFDDEWELLGFVVKTLTDAQKRGGVEVENDDNLSNIEYILRAMKEEGLNKKSICIEGVWYSRADINHIIQKVE